jgi:hypothetical protein
MKLGLVYVEETVEGKPSHPFCSACKFFNIHTLICFTLLPVDVNVGVDLQLAA